MAIGDHKGLGKVKGPTTQAASRLLLCGLLFSASALQAEETTSDAQPAANNSTTPKLVTLEQTNQQLAVLVHNQDYLAAYQLAKPLLSLYEGDPSFDFYYGFSAAQLGYFNEALFSFERLNSNYPGVARYRLELARAYYYPEPSDAADSNSSGASSNPPAQVQQTIGEFLQRIQEQRQAVFPSWGGFVSASGGYDSNYNTATDLNEVDLLDGLLTARLSRDQRAQGSGTYYQLRAQGSYISPLMAQRLGSATGRQS